MRTSSGDEVLLNAVSTRISRQKAARSGIANESVEFVYWIGIGAKKPCKNLRSFIWPIFGSVADSAKLGSVRTFSSSGITCETVPNSVAGSTRRRSVILAERQLVSAKLYLRFLRFFRRTTPASLHIIQRHLADVRSGTMQFLRIINIYF